MGYKQVIFIPILITFQGEVADSSKIKGKYQLGIVVAMKTKTVEASRRLFICMTSSSTPARDYHRESRRRPPISVGCKEKKISTKAPAFFQGNFRTLFGKKKLIIFDG